MTESQSDSVKKLNRHVTKMCNTQLSHGNNHAIVFDIDDTLVESFKVHNSESITQPIPGMLQIYNKIRDKKNVDIFLVTARPENYRSKTIEMLHDMGYYGYAHLYHRPVFMKRRKMKHDECVCYYKETARMRIENDYNKKIRLNVGDQYTDFVGGYYTTGWRIPGRYNGSCMHVDPINYAGIVR